MTNYSRSVLKSNGPHRSKNPPVKFGFSLKTVPANIAKKLPLQLRPKPLFIAFFSLAHKRPTFAFTGESGYTLGFRRRIAHSGLHAETGASPPSATAWSCATSEITLYAVFVTPDSAALLYTYISRFSENPHHQQQLYLRPSFIPIFNFSHKRPTFAFTGESGYTLGFANRIAHSGLHAETGAFWMGALLLPSEHFTRFGNPAWPGVRTANFAAFGSWSKALLKDTESLRNSDALLCASLFRGVAAPLGCVICLQLGDVAVFSLCAQYFLIVRGGGGITTLGAFCVPPKLPTSACQSG